MLRIVTRREKADGVWGNPVLSFPHSFMGRATCPIAPLTSQGGVGQADFWREFCFPFLGVGPEMVGMGACESLFSLFLNGSGKRKCNMKRGLFPGFSASFTKRSHLGAFSGSINPSNSLLPVCSVFGQRGVFVFVFAFWEISQNGNWPQGSEGRRPMSSPGFSGEECLSLVGRLRSVAAPLPLRRWACRLWVWWQELFTGCSTHSTGGIRYEKHVH